MKKLILPLSILLLATTTAKPQNTGISPSPNSSALCSQAGSVNLYTGVPSINMPLYELQTKEFSLPISLSYNASGIKVEQIASWAGLGWSLNAGGVITRAVNMIPDDMNEATNKMRKGYLYGDIASQISDFSIGANNNTKYNKLKTFTDGSFDTEPDMFYFDFCGISGKFIFDNQKNIQVIPYKNLKFEYSQDGNGEIIEFKIVDGNGIIYIFNEIEVSTIKNVYSEYGFPDFFSDLLNTTTRFNSSWYLSEIITPGNNTINFIYADESYVIEMQALKTYTQCETDNCYSNKTLHVVLTNHMSAKRLTRISTSDIQVDFIPSSFSRKDLPGSRYLSKILISSKIPGITSAAGYKFEYAYFSNRLKLKSIKNYYSESKQEPLHTFSYYEDKTLPYRMSKKQDIWGYYKSSLTESTLAPKLYVYPDKTGSERFRVYPIPGYTGTEYILPGADRLPDPEDVKTGTLKKIHYATGGHTEYEYEAHTFYYDNANYAGGGLRIKKITEHDGAGHANDKIKNYYYTDGGSGNSSGRLINKPIFAYPVNDTIYNLKYGNVEYTFDSIDYNFNSYDYYHNFLKRFNIGQATLGNSPNIGYLEVKELYGETGNNTGYKITRFSLPGGYNATNDDDGLYQTADVSYAVSNSSCAYYLDNLDFTANTFPFPPNTNYDWNRGLPLWKKYYNSSNLPVKEINYSYDLFISAKYRARNSIFGLKIGNMKPQRAVSGCYSTDDIYVFGKYKYITNATKLYTSVSETNYATGNEGDTSKAIVSTTTYLYDSFARLTETSTIQSNGSILKETFKHPSDIYLYCDEKKDKCTSRCDDLDTYPPSPLFQKCLDKCNDHNCEDNIDNLTDDYGRAIYKMRELHIGNPVIESFASIIENGMEQLTSGKLTKYKEFSGGIIRPNKALSLKTSQPISSGAFRESNISPAGVYEIDANYTTDFIYDEYDEFGNLIQAHEINGIPATMFWGYNNSLPIAKVVNAEYEETFYDGFESSSFQNDKVNWGNSGSGTRVVTDEDSYTGKYSVKFNKVNDSWSGVYMANPMVIVEPGKSYTISAMYKCNPGRRAYINWYDYTNKKSHTKTKEGTGKWELIEHTFTAPTSPKLCTKLRVYLYGHYGAAETPIYYDDIRVFPAGNSFPDAQMTTYTYDQLIGITSETDANNLTTYYYYDDFGRLETIKDDDGNIRKQIKSQNKLLADFSVNPNSLIFNESVYFTAYDYISGLTYHWDFGDGSTGTGRSTSHVYSGVGDYNVTLTISRSIANDIVKTRQVKVGYPRLEASIVANQRNFRCPETYTYVVEASGGTLQYTYEWYINEENVSTTNTMSHEDIWNNNTIKCIVNDGNSTITVFYNLDYGVCP